MKTRVEEVVGEPDAVAEARLSRRGSRVDRDDPDRQLGAADVADEALIRLDFPTPGGPRDAERYACPVSG